MQRLGRSVTWRETEKRLGGRLQQPEGQWKAGISKYTWQETVLKWIEINSSGVAICSRFVYQEQSSLYESSARGRSVIYNINLRQSSTFRPPQVDGSGFRSFTTKLEYLFWPSIENYTQTLGTFSIRFSWETANLRMSRDHGLAVAFAVCSSRLNG